MEWFLEVYEAYHKFADAHFWAAVVLQLILATAFISGVVLAVGIYNRREQLRAERREQRALAALKDKALRPKRGW